MKRYRLRYDPRAFNDIEDIYFWLAEAVSLTFAERFESRLRAYCDGLEFTPFRSSIRHGLHPDVRIVTFENCVSIGFGVDDDEVRILRILYRGRKLDDAFGPGQPSRSSE